MPTGAEDAGIFFQLIHVPVDGAHGLIGGNALFTAQDQRKLTVHRGDILPVADQPDQRAAGALYGLGDVGVRRFAVAAQEGGVLHVFSGQIAVGVAGNSQRQIRPGDLPDGSYQMVLARADLFHITGTVPCWQPSRR